MTATVSLVIRRARPSDLDAVERIENVSFSDPWSRATLATELNKDRLRLPLVAEWYREVVGYLLAWRIADQLHVLNIAVAGRHRRLGIGSALLVRAARFAVAEGLDELTLEVRRGNVAARAFYRRHGFVEIGCRPGYYPDTGEDALVLACRAAPLLTAGSEREPAADPDPDAGGESR